MIGLRSLLAPVLLFTGATHSTADPVDDYVRAQMTAHHIPGVAVVVLKNGKIVKQQAYGLANVELNVPVTIESVFPLASVTKVFTATAVYMLIDEGRIHLEDKIVQLLPGLPDAWRDITVLHCLSHTTGLPDILPGSPATGPPNWIVASTQDEALQKVGADPLVSKPGEQSSYNQTGFLLLKVIVEKKTGMRLEEFISKRIFTPLGLKSARYGDTLDIVPNRVALYMNFIPEPDRAHVKRQPNGNGLPSPDGKLWNDLNLLYPEYQHGGVGLNMSALDIARFDAALTEGKLVSSHALDAMWTPFRLNNGRNGEFAGGWDTAVLNGHRLVFHIGAGMVEYAHLIDPNFAAIVLANNQGFNPYTMTIRILRFFAPEIAAPEIAPSKP